MEDLFERQKRFDLINWDEIKYPRFKYFKEKLEKKQFYLSILIQKLFLLLIFVPSQIAREEFGYLERTNGAHLNAPDVYYYLEGSYYHHPKHTSLDVSNIFIGHHQNPKKGLTQKFLPRL